MLLGAPGTILSISAATETSGNAVLFAVTTDHGLVRYDANSGWQVLGAPGTINSISSGTYRNGLADVFVLTAEELHAELIPTCVTGR